MKKNKENHRGHREEDENSLCPLRLIFFQNAILKKEAGMFRKIIKTAMKIIHSTRNERKQFFQELSAFLGIMA